MVQGKLTKNEAWISLVYTLWRSLAYPLPTLNLTKDQCEKIITPANEFVLTAMGICRNFPRSLVFASEQYFRLGFPIYTQCKRFTDL